MRVYIPILIGLIFLSCKSPCKLKTKSSIDNRTVGTIHVAEENCPYYILVNSGAEELINKKLYPVDLHDKYKKKGLKLAFVFTYSKAMSPENCSIDGVIALDSIQVIP